MSATNTDYVTGTRVVALLTRQVELDDLWTRQATAGRADNQLARLVDEIIAGWRELQSQLDWLNALIERTATDLTGHYDDLVSGRMRSVRPGRAARPALDERLRGIVRDIVERDAGGDVTKFVARVADAHAVIDRECDQLRAEHTRIASGAQSHGDMSAEMAAIVHTTAIIVAAQTGPIGGLIVEAVGGLLDWLFG